MKNSLFIAVLLSITFFQSSAQVQFGIQLGLDQSRLSVETNDLTNTVYNAVNSENRLGFSLGVLSRFTLTKRIGLSAQPSLVFQESQLNYETVSNEIQELTVENVLVQLPVQLEYHFINIPLNPYLIGGAKMFYDVTKDDEADLKFNKNAYAIYGGVGLELPTKKFLFHPELVYAYNPSNMLDTEYVTANSTVLESARLDVVSLRLNFSGAFN